MNSPDSLISDEIGDFYRHIRGYWALLSAPQSGNGSGMLNFGYWKDGCPDLHQAQLNFLEILIKTLDEHSSLANGLEIGCGIGGISIALLNKLRNSHITAIDISSDQLAVAVDNARKSEFTSRLVFQEENAMDMSFDSSVFDFTLCIESSFHYSDKQSFFEENFRVLKPGGQAILADITCENVERIAFRKGNHFESSRRYTELAEEAGFLVESVEDIGPWVYPQLYQYILQFNKINHELNGKYWSVVLRNYALLAKEKLMGYHFYRFRKPFIL